MTARLCRLFTRSSHNVIAYQGCISWIPLRAQQRRGWRVRRSRELSWGVRYRPTIVGKRMKRKLLTSANSPLRGKHSRGGAPKGKRASIGGLEWDLVDGRPAKSNFAKPTVAAAPPAHAGPEASSELGS